MFKEIIHAIEHGQYDKVLQEIDNALISSEDQSQEHIMLKTFYAELCREKGENKEAIDLLKKLELIATQKTYQLPLLFVYSELAYNHWKLSHYKEVLNIIDKIENIKSHNFSSRRYYEMQDHILARIYNIKGLVYWHLGLLVPAADNFSLFYEKSKILNHNHGMGVALNNLGALNYTLGNVSLALEYIDKALVHWTKLQKVRGYAYAYKNLGLIYYAQNKNNLALTNLQLAFDQFGSINNQVDQAITLFNMILVCLNTSEMFSSVQEYLDQLKELSETKRRSTIIRHYEIAKHICFMHKGRLRDISKAYAYFEEFVQKETEDFRLRIMSIRYICEYLIIELKNNNLEEVYIELTEYIQKLREIGESAPSYGVIVESLILEAKIVFASGGIQRAEELLLKAKEVATKHGHLDLVHRVENEKTLFASRIASISRMLESDATKYELLNEVEMKSYIDEVKKMIGI